MGQHGIWHPVSPFEAYFLFLIQTEKDMGKNLKVAEAALSGLP
jgi:hypothetical protein